MERDQEVLMKHVCKLCNKRYPSGKSLGGHMRSHVIADYKKNKLLLQQQKINNNDNNNNKVTNFIVDYEDDDEEDGDGYGEDFERNKEKENGGNSGYGLRENPKKSWRLVSSKVDKHQQGQGKVQQVQEVEEERVCKQCGKKFQSLKALCGHMSSHSDKEKKFRDNEDDNSWFSGSLSDNNNNNNIDNNHDNKRQTRASMSRYNSNTNSNNNISKSLACVESFGGGGGGGGSSSNNSEIDQLEQEEVAMCLMMLSRDNNKKCFNLGPESSDNNSVILEGGGGGDKKKEGVVVQDLDNSDSGYFENGAKELESDDSVDGFVKNCYYYGIKKPNKSHDLGSGFGLSCDDKSKRKIRYVGNNFGFDSLESEQNSSKKMKKDQYETSKITFKTHQGHNVTNFDGRSSANKSQPWSNNGKNLVTYNSNNNNNNTGSNNTTSNYNYVKKGSGSKKVKIHKCPYCPKVYKSGQALGGHKRSHMMGSGGVGVGVVFNRLNARALISEPKPESEQKQPLIDLNFPAPLEEEESENSQW